MKTHLDRFAMATRTKKFTYQFEVDRQERVKKFAAFVKRLTQAQIKEAMINAGILTKSGNLTARHRHLPALIRQSGAEPSPLLCPRR